MADTKKPLGTSTRTQLVNLAAANGFELFHSPDGHPFASFTNAGHRETLSLTSSGFTDHLAREYYRAKKKVVSGSDLKDAIRVLSASAKHAGPEHRVHVRLARVDNVIWLDLGRPDWGAIRVGPGGWKYVAIPEPKFRRPRGLLALPMPERGTESLSDTFKRLLNIPDPMMVIAWQVGALRGRKPYPSLVIIGEQGTAKTWTSRLLRRSIDPNVADLRLPPKEPRDLMIAALNSHVVAYDNLSVIQDWLSDALCALSTGGGFSTRELFSDLDETLFSADRPILLNGINNIVTRPDLLDRSLVVTLEPIPENKRKSEAVLEAEFAAAHPAILAALLDAVACALANEATTKLDGLPRMADFATWIEASAPALGWQPAQFLKAYRTNQNDAIEAVLEGDVISDVIKGLIEKQAWTGQLKDLLALVPEHEHKPKSPRGLRSALIRKAPALRQVGITMKFEKGHTHTLKIFKTSQTELDLDPSERHFADADAERPFSTPFEELQGDDPPF